MPPRRLPAARRWPRPRSWRPAAAVVVALIVAAGGPAVAGAGAPPAAPGTFLDEFAGADLDPSSWVRRFPWGRDSTTTPSLRYRDDNVEVSRGTLRLHARWDGRGGGRYSSGIVTTSGRHLFHGGRIEARVKLPGGAGVWPAVWMLPPDGRWPPEIDVIETIGRQPHTAHLHLHVEEGGRHVDVPGAWRSPTPLVDTWHTYAVEWDPGVRLTWFVDGVPRHEVRRPLVPDEPMYLILNLQVGGSWAGEPDPRSLPTTMEVDWVRGTPLP